MPTSSNQPIDRDRFLIAYGMYRAMQLGAGIATTGRPYPVKPWSALRDCDRVRFLRRAHAYAALPAGDEADRLYQAWFCDNRRPDGTLACKPFAQLKPGIKEIWFCVAQVFAALDQDREAA